MLRRKLQFASNMTKVLLLSELLIFVYSLEFTTASEIPSDCNNAASLYLQAINELPVMNTIEEGQARDSFVANHRNMSDTLRNYLDECQRSLELTKAASQIEYCNWGEEYSSRFLDLSKMTHLASVSNLTFVIYAEAIRHAHDHNQRSALEYGLILQRFAEHIGSGSLLSQNTFNAVSIEATNTIRETLSYDPATTQTLTWLQSQFITRKTGIRSFLEAFDNELVLLFKVLKSDVLFKQAREEALVGSYPGNIENMTDDELFAHISQPLLYYKDKMKRTIALHLPVSQILTEIDEIVEITGHIYDVNYPPIVRQYFSPTPILSPAFTRTYALSVRSDAEFSAMQSAIELYDIVTQIGNLPDVLPDYLPKDPFTRSAFDYEITPEGFIFRYRELFSPDNGELNEKVFEVPVLIRNR